MKTRTKKQKGVISLETAILMPVVLGCILMFFDISRLHLQYGLLENAMRHTLRELLADDWRRNPITSGRIKNIIEKRSFGMLDSVTVQLKQFDSLETLLQTEEDEADADNIYRPRDPVYRVSATLTTSIKFSPLGFFEPKVIKKTSTIIISEDSLAN
ncbi:TadE/TadG family type IV pilus assembly protein [Vibrio sonorensis]|uniref:TadE/TadG family type IV pilus assembly protein n=1 Tax=Vibrio sonorensis TaxID=1004316 RepID=UPI001FE15A74|nr:TadE/TadG family type IV pilus assembly protein [Vibrio sonorensis]